eukprot:GILI01015531.1.p1 GENE.GILI01015531.1~~GILI01015531.1.p1  ORF type:complete len:240 (+),score=72.08 GILI01015531.1:43-720(+)
MESVKGNSAKIREEVSKAQEKLDRWSADVMKNLEKSAREHDSRQRTNEESLKQLSLQEGALRERARDVQQAIEKETRLLEAKDAELSSLKQEATALPSSLSELSQLHEQQREVLKAKQKELSEQEQQRRRVTGEMSRVLDYYRDRLGLHFNIEDGALKVVFTLVDSAQPDREFAFTISVDNDVYSLRSVSPPVPGVEEHLTKLNSDNDLSAFMVTMRSKFRALVA